MSRFHIASFLTKIDNIAFCELSCLMMTLLGNASGGNRGQLKCLAFASRKWVLNFLSSLLWRQTLILKSACLWTRYHESTPTILHICYCSSDFVQYVTCLSTLIFTVTAVKHKRGCNFDYHLQLKHLHFWKLRTRTEMNHFVIFNVFQQRVLREISTQ
jgi:hypothetical protein